MYDSVLVAYQCSETAARFRPRHASAAMQSRSNSTDFSFVHVDDASAERPHGDTGDLDDATSSDLDIGAGATAAAACGAATGASSVGSAAGAVAPGLASVACGAATGASSADSAACAVAPGLGFGGRIVGFASVFVQRADGTMYVAPLLGPSTEGPYSWGSSRPIHPWNMRPSP